MPSPRQTIRRALVVGLSASAVGCGGEAPAAGPAPAPRVPAPARERPPLGAAFPGTAPVARPDPYRALLARLPDRRSRALGSPGAGRLEGGVRFPAAGPDHVTWDPVTKERPSRAWRRVGTSLTVRRTLRALRALRRAQPRLGRVLVGDLSRPRGGSFGKRYGIVGHRTHQNGRDVDVYFPRRDRRSAVPRGAADVDQRAARTLVTALLRAGASRVLVGPGIRADGSRVAVVPGHDDHAHATF